MFDARRPLVFMHVPKTAGSSFAAALKQALAPKNMVFGFDRSLFGKFEHFSTIDASILRDIYLAPELIPRDAQLITGHMALSTLLSTYADGQFVTLLREPVSRLLSNWLFWRQTDEHNLLLWGKWADTVRSSHGRFSDFLNTAGAIPHVDNPYLRALVWPHQYVPDNALISAAHDDQLLDLAFTNLRRFDFVDIIEDPLLFQTFADWLGMPIENVRVNVTEAMPDRLRCSLDDELTPAVYDRLGTLTRLDRQLWEYVARRVLGHSHIRDLAEQTRRKTLARYRAMMN